MVDFPAILLAKKKKKKRKESKEKRKHVENFNVWIILVSLLLFKKQTSKLISLFCEAVFWLEKMKK